MSQDVEAAAYFIGNEKNEFPVGSTATALISFDNQGTGAFEVKTIEGSFRYPQDFRYYLQNFTIDVVNVTVPAGEQVRILCSRLLPLKPDFHVLRQPRQRLFTSSSHLSSLTLATLDW